MRRKEHSQNVRFSYSRTKTCSSKTMRKKIQQRTKSTVVGKARIMTYEDIVAAKRKREEKEAAREL
ncbi:hypothetical protein BDV12DRAFT_174688 [Aspergillus spectabilis]